MTELKRMNESFEKFLAPTPLIEADHPAIWAKAETLMEGAVGPAEKARCLFDFVRDEVGYVFRAPVREARAFRASEILRVRRGYCTQKAILFCALARSCRIPAGICFYDIVDHTLSERVVRLLRTRTLVHHGVAALHLNGVWRVFDATLDRRLVEQNNLIPVEFDPEQDCLMHPETRDGRKHVEYVEDYGLVADVSFEELMGWFKEGYPHLFG